MDEINRKRLEWVAKANSGANFPTILFNFNWGETLSAAAQAALDEIDEKDRTLVTWAIHGPQAAWRPIAEAPIPPMREAPAGFIFNCMIQTARGIVGEGCARYVSDGRVRGSKQRPILRWYYGDGTRSGNVCHDPRYFQPLPQPRKD